MYSRDKHSGAPVKAWHPTDLQDGEEYSLEEVMAARQIEGIVVVDYGHGRPTAMLEEVYQEHYA
jgi:hypothetical protein